MVSAVDGDPLERIRRARWRAFVVEYVRLTMTGHKHDDAARKAAGYAFHGFSRPEAAVAKARRLLADPTVAAAIASRIPRRANSAP